MKIRPVILCGGSGTRLWSDKKHHQPKQFIDFGNWTLFGKTLSSINKAKWNIYYVALQDLTFYSFSYLNYFFKYEDIAKSKMIYEEILHDELKNGMPDDIVAKGKATFDKRLEEIDWKKYFSSLPFNKSALALYEWAPIAEELKTLDRKIVLNSMILKWDNIKEEFEKRINF